jgi:hypothetical protein
MKQKLLYLGRWQLSSLVLAPVIMLVDASPIIQAVVANLIGGIIFFNVDRLIFKKF